MYIGYLRNKSKPQKFARLLARTTQSYGNELVHFHPEDINIEKRLINGQVFENNRWLTKEVPIPKFIDISTYCFKHRNIVDFLKEQSILSIERRLGSKDVVNEKIIEDGEFADYIIPSSNCNDLNQFYSFVYHHKEIIIKPKNGQRGKGIFKVSLNGTGYLLNYDQEEEFLNKEELADFYSKKIKRGRYIFQKCIQSYTKEGSPFDCRIRLEKNGKGVWEVVIYLVRIGSGHKVVSNISQGGSVSKLIPFLKANYDDKWEQIYIDIKAIANRLPVKLEEIFQTRLTALGLDIGIDKDGTIYLFETNTTPGSEFAMGELALLKSAHYNYILNNIQ
ncbi:YheC/YheD family protein [Bacillus sp. H-16]|uniref:YheC/YheD family protein n=1 Tax=Alteribacter salitolerans TaxID=2912333 RepID=UPI0019647473|nr:YheC/YheD family protein [Alteribacter salitolerans]MBM7095805.1 YheC/YheD family protein [Alteribacter salitolerans]